MALPNPLFIAFQGLQTYFSDATTSSALVAGSVEFYRDVNRTVPKDVYQQVQLPDNTYDFVNIGSVVTLNAAGAFSSPVDGTDIQVYAYPYINDPSNPNPGAIDLYFLQVYDYNGVFQFSREAQPANAVFADNPNESFLATANEITNPQFVQVLFPSPSIATTFSVSGSNTVTDIAPNWSIVTTGTGSFTVTQRPTSAALPSNPPYFLTITSTGLSGNVQLVQTLTASPRLLVGEYIASSMLVMGAGVPFTMTYIPSNNASSDLILCSGTGNADGSATVISGTIAANPSVINVDQAPSGNVKISISFTANTSVSITSVQVAGVESAASSVEFIEQSTPMQINGLFNYYLPPLSFKPIKSYLVGWDFALNPAQFNGYSVAAVNTGANGSYYVWDQTILFQNLTSAFTISEGQNDAITITATKNNAQFALVQYLDDFDALDMALNNLSVNVRMNASAPTLPLTMTVSLWWTTGTLPNPPIDTNFQSFINTLDANGHPNSVQSGWTEIPNAYGNGKFVVNSSSSTEFPLNGWLKGQANSIPTNVTYFAIAVGSEAMNSGNFVRINSISCVPGNIATIPAPQTVGEVLRDCQRYFEMSYAPYNTNSPIASIGNANALTYINLFYNVSSTIYAALQSNFQINYQTSKRALPALSFYSPKTGTAATLTWYASTPAGVSSGVDASLPTYWVSYAPGTERSSFAGNMMLQANMGTFSSSSISINSFTAFHYTADATLGNF